MAQLNPYLRFNGNCREAMSFYKECLGGELTIQTVGESPMASQMPEAKDLIMHSALKKEGFTLMASDMIEPGKIVKGNNISLSISGADEKEIKTYFSKLSLGGKVTHALKEEFFGLYGDLVDKFGIKWMFESDKPKV